MNIERLIFVMLDETEHKLLHRIGQILPILQQHVIAIARVRFVAHLRIPIFSTAIEAEIFIESKITRLQWQLAPLPAHRCHVTGRLENFRNHRFVFRLHERTAIVPCHASVIRIAPRQQQSARRTAQRRGITMLETRAALRQLINVRRLEMIRAVATHVADSQIVGENKNNIGLLGRGISGIQQ